MTVREGAVAFHMPAADRRAPNVRMGVVHKHLSIEIVGTLAVKSSILARMEQPQGMVVSAHRSQAVERLTGTAGDLQLGSHDPGIAGIVARSSYLCET